MRIRFNGIVERHTTGCHSCGAHKTDLGFTMKKRYILPSGAAITFRVGCPVEVSDEDAEFLLSYKYTDSNGIHQVFEHDDSAGD